MANKTKAKSAVAITAPRAVKANAAALKRAAAGTSWPPSQLQDGMPSSLASSTSTSTSSEAVRTSKALRAQRHMSLPLPLPLPMLSPGSFESLNSASMPLSSTPSSSTRGNRRHSTTLLSPPATPGTPSTLSDRGNSRRDFGRDLDRESGTSISAHRLRSNSGMALHTNSAALRRYIDYNQDGSTRLSPTGEMYDEQSSVDGGASSSRQGSVSPPTRPEGPGLFSRDVVLAVLQDPDARRRLWDFARGQDSEESLEFLEKVEEYSKAVHGVVALLATISTQFTSVGASDPLHLPQRLARPLNADIMQVSRSVLPGLEMLFGAATAYIEERIIHDIYPAFVKNQLNVRMKASLGAPSASLAQHPFSFTGLGHAFCLTDPFRPDNPVVYASDSFAHIIGYARAEDIPRSGRCLSDPLLGDDAHRGHFTQEIVLNRRWWDKRPFWSHVSVSPLQSSRGHTRFSLVSLVDISSVVKTQDEILKALKCGPAISDRPLRSRETSTPKRHMKERPTSLILESHHRPTFEAPQSPRLAPSSSTKSFFNHLSRIRRSSGNGASPDYQFDASDEVKSRSTPTMPMTPICEANLPMYSRFMLLQFVPGTSRYDAPAPAPPPISRHGRHSNSSHAPALSNIRAESMRLKVAFCSSAMLELFGLESSAQDAVLYHDIFSVLSELAGSPSISSMFRNAVRQRLAASEPASLELSIPAMGSPALGHYSAGSVAGLDSPAEEDDEMADSASRRSSRFHFSRSKKHSSERPRSSTASERRMRDPRMMQRLMSHWTPLKDADGAIAWIALVLSPVQP